MFIDTHCHPNMAKNKNTEDILNNFFKNGWKYLFSIWTDLDNSIKSISLSNKYKNVYSSVWIHPSDSLTIKWDINQNIKKIEDLYLTNKENIIWIWEIWLDYYWLDKWKENIQKEHQKQYFRAQLKLSKKYNLWVIIHNRDAWNDILDILEREKVKKFIIHSYSEDYDFAKKALEISNNNCFFWFWWIMTFKNADKIQDTAKRVSLKNIIIETDSPYLTPTPLRGKEENEPIFVKHVYEYLVKLRNESPEEILKTLYNNSIKIIKNTD